MFLLKQAMDLKNYSNICILKQNKMIGKKEIKYIRFNYIGNTPIPLKQHLLQLNKLNKCSKELFSIDSIKSSLLLSVLKFKIFELDQTRLPK